MIFMFLQQNFPLLKYETLKGRQSIFIYCIECVPNRVTAWPFLTFSHLCNSIS